VRRRGQFYLRSNRDENRTVFFTVDGDGGTLTNKHLEVMIRARIVVSFIGFRFYRHTEVTIKVQGLTGNIHQNDLNDRLFVSIIYYYFKV